MNRWQRCGGARRRRHRRWSRRELPAARGGGRRGGRAGSGGRPGWRRRLQSRHGPGARRGRHAAGRCGRALTRSGAPGGSAVGARRIGFGGSWLCCAVRRFDGGLHRLGLRRQRSSGRGGSLGFGTHKLGENRVNRSRRRTELIGNNHWAANGFSYSNPREPSPRKWTMTSSGKKKTFSSALEPMSRTNPPARERTRCQTGAPNCDFPWLATRGWYEPRRAATRGAASSAERPGI